MVQFCKIFILSPKRLAIYTLRKIKTSYQNSLQGVVPAKEKAELLKLIYSKKNAFRSYWQLKCLNTKSILAKVFCGHRTQFQFKLSLIICKKGKSTEDGQDKA